MPDALAEDAVADQASGSSESGVQGQTGGGGNRGAIGETGRVQSTQDDNAKGDNLGQDNLPPELDEQRKELLRGFHEKTQAFSEEKRTLEGKLLQAQQDSEVLAKLMQQEWFNKAATEEKARRSGVSPKMTDDEFEALRSDKQAFEQHLERREKALERAMLEKLELVRRDTDGIRLERQVDFLKSKYSDFDALMKNGAMKKYLDEGISFENAYRLAKDDIPKSPAKLQEEAQKLLAAKRAGSVDRGGVTGASGNRVIKVKKGLNMNELWALAEANPDATLEKE